LQVDRPLDRTDWRILAELQRNGRLSFNQLARLVNLSSPAVAERVRRLEESGVIAGYQARVDPARAGLPLTAFVQMRCTPGRCLLKTTAADDFPEVVEVHKLTGSSCSMLRVRVASMQHFEGLLERLGEHGEMNTHVVLSTQYEGRAVEEPAADARPVTDAAGWSRERSPGPGGVAVPPGTPAGRRRSGRGQNT
jgi:Lrp/AsnC family leucine-responsive transcriptional regulator